MAANTEDLIRDRDGLVLRLTPDTHRLGEARQFVQGAITRWGGAAAEAVLMTSEVVTNAMMHVGEQVILRVRRDGARALVEVQDHSSELPKVRPPDSERVGGYGLHIIEALAVRWGVTPVPDDGKVVWFEIPLPA